MLFEYHFSFDIVIMIIISLENIDYSICTLEFESRRESYYWVLEALDMYRPKVGIVFKMLFDDKFMYLFI